MYPSAFTMDHNIFGILVFLAFFFVRFSYAQMIEHFYAKYSMKMNYSSIGIDSRGSFY